MVQNHIANNFENRDVLFFKGVLRYINDFNFKSLREISNDHSRLTKISNYILSKGSFKTQIRVENTDHFQVKDYFSWHEVESTTFQFYLKAFINQIKIEMISNEQSESKIILQNHKQKILCELNVQYTFYFSKKLIVQKFCSKNRKS